MNDYPVKDFSGIAAAQSDNFAHLWGFDYLARFENAKPVKTSKRLLSWQKKVHLEKIFGGLYEELSILSQRSETDVIVAANINMVWGLGYLRRWMRLPPIVAVLHSIPSYESRLYKFFMRNHLCGIDRILCLAKKDHHYLTSTLRLDPSRVLYVPWAVNPKDFDLDRNDGAPAQAPSRKYIISIGKAKRDYATLIRAFAEMRLPWLDLKIFDAGQTKERSFGSENIILRKEFVPFKECVREYRGSEFIVIPLCGSQRTLGLTSLYDAMAVGKAFIMTKNPGVDIDIEKEKIGFWTEPGDVKDLKEKMLTLLEHPELAAEYGSNGRKYLEEKYNYGNFCKKLHEVVLEVCGVAA